jgi:hypothetical protein
LGAEEGREEDEEGGEGGDEEVEGLTTGDDGRSWEDLFLTSEESAEGSSDDSFMSSSRLVDIYLLVYISFVLNYFVIVSVELCCCRQYLLVGSINVVFTSRCFRFIFYFIHAFHLVCIDKFGGNVFLAPYFTATGKRRPARLLHLARLNWPKPRRTQNLPNRCDKPANARSILPCLLEMLLPPR